MHHPIVKVIADQGCQSYVIACPDTRACLLVDPKLGRRKTFHQVIQDFAVHPVAVLDTHTHADHLSDAAAFARAGVPVHMSRLTATRRAVTRLGDGDELRVGNLRFTVAEVPGHTADSIALHGHGLCVSGDTLLVGALARADFRGSDPALLYESVKARILSLADDTVVLPAHSYNDVLFTTVGVERRNNRAFTYADGAAFAAAEGGREGAGNTPDVDRMLQLNQEANPVLPEDAGAVAACCAAGPALALATPREMSVQELGPQRAEITARAAWVDVRDAYEFSAQHIPGTRNVPLGELGFHLQALRGRDPLVLSCLGGVRSMTAARTLRYLGVVAEPISMAGGFRAWSEAGLEVVRR